ncbi:MAG: glycosyltransferase family 2 protein [Roseobacter sp.]|jgi:GT2 family glycosyltransferase|nr:glycosyltransferase family 2 protein [Roseobacter sp.]
MTASDPTVLAIILNYKTAEMTLKCIAAARIAMAGISGAITVVDNDSQDGSFERISAYVTEQGWNVDDQIRVIQSGHNGGFGAGNNVGINAGLPDGSKPDFVYILNSDAFPAPDAIRVLLDHMQSSPKTGFAGSFLSGAEDDPHVSSFRFHSIASEFEGSVRLGVVSRLLKNSQVPIGVPTETTSVGWVAGASVLVRQSMLDEIGLFDETFFLYFEEVDLCLRAARAGYGTDYVPTSKVTHIGSVSTGMKDWDNVPSYWYDSRWHYFSKNHGKLYAVGATLAHFLGGGLHKLRCMVTSKKARITPGFLTTMLAHDASALVRHRTPPHLQSHRSTVS